MRAMEAPGWAPTSQRGEVSIPARAHWRGHLHDADERVHLLGLAAYREATEAHRQDGSLDVT